MGLNGFDANLLRNIVNLKLFIDGATENPIGVALTEGNLCHFLGVLVEFNQVLLV